MMVRAIIASDRLLPHSNGHWGPITTAPFSRLYTQSFHFNLRHRDDGHASGELRGLHRGELPLLPYHHNHYQQQPSHRVMWCLGAVIIQLGDGRWWQCLGLCCLNDFSLGEVLQLKTKVLWSRFATLLVVLMTGKGCYLLMEIRHATYRRVGV